MDHETPSSKLKAPLCQHHTSTGRQCRCLAQAGSLLCFRHAVMPQNDSREDFSRALLRDAARFQNAQGINHSLRELYTLLAQDRISSRRASVLAYISNLLLHTLPAIDKDPYPTAGLLPLPHRIAPTPESEVPTSQERASTMDLEAGDDPPQPSPDDPLKSSKPN